MVEKTRLLLLGGQDAQTGNTGCAGDSECCGGQKSS